MLLDKYFNDGKSLLRKSTPINDRHTFNVYTYSDIFQIKNST